VGQPFAKNILGKLAGRVGEIGGKGGGGGGGGIVTDGHYHHQPTLSPPPPPPPPPPRITTTTTTTTTGVGLRLDSPYYKPINDLVIQQMGNGDIEKVGGGGG